MKYTVIDIMLTYSDTDLNPGTHYAPRDEVLGVVEASSGDEAIAMVMRSIGVDSLRAWDEAGYEKHILAYVKAIPVRRYDDNDIILEDWMERRGFGYDDVCEDCGDLVANCQHGCDIEETHRDDGETVPPDYHNAHKHCPYAAGN